MSQVPSKDWFYGFVWGIYAVLLVEIAFWLIFR